jgi:hypothetical protein
MAVFNASQMGKCPAATDMVEVIKYQRFVA